MNNKICVITGGSQGIGKATAKGLAEQGATVVIVCRDEERGNAARREIIDVTQNTNIYLELADLSVSYEVRELAERLTTNYPAIHVLINNHTALFEERKLSRDSIEMTFALNHLAYYLLTMLLIDTLQAQPSRIINVSAEVHRSVDADFLNDLYFREDYNPWDSFCQAKLCNILFTYELARRLNDSSVTVNCLHPGTASTKALHDARAIISRLHGKTNFTVPGTAEQAAKTSIYLASSPDVEGISGKYFIERAAIPSSVVTYDPDIAETLWQICADLTGVFA